MILEAFLSFIPLDIGCINAKIQCILLLWHRSEYISPSIVRNEYYVGLDLNTLSQRITSEGLMTKFFICPIQIA